MKVQSVTIFADKETGKTYTHGDILDVSDARAKELIKLGKVSPYSGDKPVKTPSNIPSAKPDKEAEKADKNVETQGDKVKGDDLKDNDKFHTKKDVKPNPQKK